MAQRARKKKDKRAHLSKKAIEGDLSVLCQAIRLCGEDESVLQNFLRDLLTGQEIRTYKVRWQIAQRLLLDEGEALSEVAADVGVSTATVSRVKQKIYGETSTGGFAEVYRRLPHL
jgi:uncharacterized protein YerC